MTPIAGARYTQYDAEYDLCSECYRNLDPLQRLEYYDAAAGPDPAVVGGAATPASAPATASATGGSGPDKSTIDEEIARLETTLNAEGGGGGGDCDHDTEGSSSSS
eukprot:COSAG05_NODE_5351_length_1199_cov_5.475347_1_plen_105_part_10